ncbi:MAG: glycosyltransferase family 4 protein, partial [Proteobacteria bacterium]|nr:glycosyltransferase family 4 protein [Pseudomonadota bacterium]
ASFVIVGADGAGESGYTDQMKCMAQKNKVLDHFIFLGKRDDIPEVMNTFDLLVVPSRAEPFGKVIIEAMACNKCVIASEVGGIPEILIDGENGLLVPSEDIEALKTAILKVIENKEFANNLANNGLSTVRDHFSIDALVNKTQQLYSNLIKDQ